MLVSAAFKVTGSSRMLMYVRMPPSGWSHKVRNVLQVLHKCVQLIVMRRTCWQCHVTLRHSKQNFKIKIIQNIRCAVFYPFDGALSVITSRVRSVVSTPQYAALVMHSLYARPTDMLSAGK